MKNSQLKRKLIFAKNQQIIKQLNEVKQSEIRMIVALQDGIKCAFTGEHSPRQEIARMDYRRAFNRYIDDYCYLLKLRQELADIQVWEPID